MEREVKFEYVFDLSWTTFSTVGYGMFSPESSADCWGIRFICAFEAFVGILYHSACGAYLYSKVSRIQFTAPITFSRIMCLQYGKGLLESDRKNSTTGYFWTERNPDDSRDFPFIEFRIVHNDCGKYKRAMFDASLSCYVILPTGTSVSVSDKGYTVPNHRHSMSYTEEEPVGYQEKMDFPGKVYHELKIENKEIPFFDKVWYVRHSLDENSPLVKEEVKQKIRNGGGEQWPQELNSHESIRNSLIEFNVITVQLKGMSQVTADSVYAEMEYDSDDVYVGWQFTGLLYKVKDIYGNSKMVVDKSLLHDIAPQRGGGNEPIHPCDL